MYRRMIRASITGVSPTDLDLAPPLRERKMLKIKRNCGFVHLY